jgi:hypothetical protein
MKKLLIFTAFTINSMTMGADLICKVKVNSEEALETKVIIDEGQKIKYASAENFTFFVKQINSTDYEIELLDMSVPSRSYAKASLNSGADKLQYSLWSRDMILESNCRIAE